MTRSLGPEGEVQDDDVEDGKDENEDDEDEINRARRKK